MSSHANNPKNKLNNKLNNKSNLTNALEININLIEPNRQQPRKYFDEDALLELAQSLLQYGMLQPIIVKPVDDYYELIAGERRWRAAKIAGLNTIPVILKEFTSSTTFEVALVENLLRENLNPIEEAESFQKLHLEFGLSHEAIADKVGRNRSTIVNSIRLLQLDSKVRSLVASKKLSNGHARALLGINDSEKQFQIAQHILESGMTVRHTEELVKQEVHYNKVHSSKNSTSSESQFDSEFLSESLSEIPQTTKSTIENSLESILSTKVRIKSKRKKGKIEIDFYSEDDLDRLFHVIKGMKG